MHVSQKTVLFFDSLLCYTVVICKTCLKNIQETIKISRVYELSGQPSYCIDEVANYKCKAQLGIHLTLIGAHFTYISAPIASCIIGSLCKGRMGPVAHGRRPLAQSYLCGIARCNFTGPSWRRPLLGFHSVVALLTIRHDRISCLLVAPDARMRIRSLICAFVFRMWPK